MRNGHVGKFTYPASLNALSMSNIFSDIPANLTEELFENLAEKPNVKIERIISKGHTSPKQGWYEQAQDEWVIVLQGEAIITFEDSEKRLGSGDYLMISAGVKHKVSWTKPDIETVWLAVFC